jgi:THO complex subunit 2
MSSLPSSKDANKALKGFSKSQEEWRKLILEVIELSLEKNDITTDAAVKETCFLILQALNQFRNDASDDDEYSTAESIVVDALWLKGAMIEDSIRPQTPAKEDGDEKAHDEELEILKTKHKSLCKLIKLLSSTTSAKDLDSSMGAEELIPIPVRRFQLSLEPSLLAASELLPNKSVDFFIKRMKKVNTEMFYRQKKVNLMQEESEGYSKYMRFLTTLPLMNDTNSGHHASDAEGEDNMKSGLKEMELRVSEFIGTFDLDPNRCLDLTLDVLEAHINQVISDKHVSIYDSVRNAPAHCIAIKQLLSIIRLFPIENISHLIGFKYTNIQDGASKSLHVTTSILIQHELVSLDVLRPHLPQSNLVRSKYSEWEKNAKTRIRKLGVVSLNASKTDENDEQKIEAENNDDHSEIISLLELFHTLLEVGMKWNHAICIFGKDGKVTATNACSIYPKLGKTLCELLERRLSTMYSVTVQDIGSDLIKEDRRLTRNTLNPLHSLLLATASNVYEPLITSSSLVEVCEGLSDVFDAVVSSSCIAHHSILYVKLCRLVKVLLQKIISGDDASVVQVDKLDPTVLSFLELFLVPSISHFPNNPAIASELWSVLMLLPYQIRYALYSSSRKLGLEKAALRSMSRPPKPLLQIESEVNTSISTKFIFKRMSKENVKDMGRQLARVAHNNPMVVFTLMLNQIESYDNLIEMMVDSFKYMGLLSLDVMGYCLLVSLGGEGEVRDKVKGKSEIGIELDFMIIYIYQMNLPTSNRFRSQRMASTQHNGFLR